MLNIKKETLADFGIRNITRYATEVNLDRAVPELYDGLKPVLRRVAWSANQFKSGDAVKSAKIVGNCIGTYHPHGDCLDAETEFYCLDGKVRTIKELYEQGTPIDVLSYDSKKNTLVPAVAHSFRIGQYAKKTYRITLSSGKTIEATGNHQFYVNDFGWVKTESLEPGMFLASGSIDMDADYRTIAFNGNTRTRIYTYIKANKKNFVRHHINHNTHDDRPNNLKSISRASHAECHKNYLNGLSNGRKTMFDSHGNSNKELAYFGTGVFITKIETLKHTKAKPMYDFTVDGYQNALILLPKKHNGHRVCVVAHNSSVYGAMQTMVHQNVPLLEGVGNWGNLLDPAAAYRYTNARLSKIGQAVFDPRYTSVMNMVPNFDDTTKEPVVLPVRLPFLVLNGAEGIGVGITCSIPTFTLESVIKVLTALFSGEKISYEYLAKTLKPKQHWGGSFVNTKANRAQWLQLMKTGKAKVLFESALEVDEKKKEIIVSEWPSGLNPDKFIQKVRNLPECQRAFNSKGSTTFKIECKRTCTLDQFDNFVNKVQKMTQVYANYKFNCTHRVSTTKDGITTFNTEFLSLGVGEFFIRWGRLRLDLEKRSLKWQISKLQDAIDYSNLLIYASDNLSIIFKALRQQNSSAYLQKYLKVTEKQAQQILDLKVRTLSKLDQTELKRKLKLQNSDMRQLKSFLADPKTKVVSDFDNLLTFVFEDAKMRGKRLNQALRVV